MLFLPGNIHMSLQWITRVSILRGPGTIDDDVVWFSGFPGGPGVM